MLWIETMDFVLWKESKKRYLATIDFRKKNVYRVYILCRWRFASVAEMRNASNAHRLTGSSRGNLTLADFCCCSSMWTVHHRSHLFGFWYFIHFLINFSISASVFLRSRYFKQSEALRKNGNCVGPHTPLRLLSLFVQCVYTCTASQDVFLLRRSIKRYVVSLWIFLRNFFFFLERAAFTSISCGYCFFAERASERDGDGDGKEIRQHHIEMIMSDFLLKLRPHAHFYLSRQFKLSIVSTTFRIHFIVACILCSRFTFLFILSTLSLSLCSLLLIARPSLKISFDAFEIWFPHINVNELYRTTKRNAFSLSLSLLLSLCPCERAQSTHWLGDFLRLSF